jgi:hypothetical protein
MNGHAFNRKAAWLLCTKCGGSERSLPTDCPGYRLSYEELQHVLVGKTDFRKGGWIATQESAA